MSDINQDKWRSQLENDEDFIILDVRTSEEFNEQRLPNSINIDFYNPQNFILELEKLDKNKTLIIFDDHVCFSKRLNFIKKNKFKHIIFYYNLTNHHISY